MFGLPEVARAFQGAGITAMIYDPRSVGLSDGTPRNDIDPFKQIEDYSDALTFLGSLPLVDPNCMGIWGISLSGAVALCTASFDKRAKLVIAVCPVAEYHYARARIQNVLVKCFKDRESQVKGNPPFYIPMLNDSGENPAGFEFGLDREKAAQMVAAGKEGRELAPGHVNRTTIQSYHKLLMWHPGAMWKDLYPTPVMFIVPEKDHLCPAEVQMQYFQQLQGPKRSYIQAGRGHMDILEGESFTNLMKLQIQFLRDALDGTV
jgi:pimeloyl-ACP methyl ester carboxylesterase